MYSETYNVWTKKVILVIIRQKYKIGNNLAKQWNKKPGIAHQNIALLHNAFRC